MCIEYTPSSAVNIFYYVDLLYSWKGGIASVRIGTIRPSFIKSIRQEWRFHPAENVRPDTVFGLNHELTGETLEECQEMVEINLVSSIIPTT